ncbi:MAG: DUF4445 domain-containing protein [Lachnospiraceae bacterium]|nr:DUF4445 domain-containing protein [Lachnospiraceae bacterium]
MDKTIETITAEGNDLYIDKDTVFKQIKCDRDNPMYEEFEEEFNELLPQVKAALKPRAALGFDAYPGNLKGGTIKPETCVLYLIATVGQEICDLTSGYFASGDYVKGMLCDACASAALFSFEKPIFAKLRQMCADRHVGIKKRYEAPGHVPMEIQKVAYESLNAGETLGLKISSGYMYEPVKSTCQVFETTDNERTLHLTHGCADCSNMDCPHRVESVVVRIKAEGGDYEFTAAPGTNLMELVRENGISVNAMCGGAGRCGKCAVRVLEGNIEVSDDDRNIFTAAELAGGYRLACRASVSEDCRVELVYEAEEDMVSLSLNKVMGKLYADSDLGIAIDIGTTTIALTLIDLEDGGIIDTYTAINPQRSLGADVITRIGAAVGGKAKELRRLIGTALLKGIEELLQGSGASEGSLKKICIAGNTTMMHLLSGYPVEGLGVYPFTPYRIELETRRLGEVLDTDDGLSDALKGIRTILLPGNSAFVGADIVAGLYSCGFHENEKTCALIDLGTNGEMAIGGKNRLMVTSTAAGPAFEGGNIKWGVGSIPGAISAVTIEDGRARIETIGETREVTGICGTGVIEVTAELLKNELMDETGVLDEEYFEDGFCLAKSAKGEDITFTQKDIREIQLAKSAIRAGFETMLLRYGAKYEDIDTLYIAGGFGYYLNVKKAALIGMIPEELLEKCRAAGNTSLSGALKYLVSGEEAAQQTVSELARMGEEIALSSDKDFNELYMEYMMFECNYS